MLRVRNAPVSNRVAAAESRGQTTMANYPPTTDRFVAVEDTRAETAGAAAAGTVACSAFNPTVWVLGSVTGLVAPLIATVCSPCEGTTTTVANQ